VGNGCGFDNNPVVGSAGSRIFGTPIHEVNRRMSGVG
jgi:hypothetical protein